MRTAASVGRLRLLPPLAFTGCVYATDAPPTPTTTAVVVFTVARHHARAYAPLDHTYARFGLGATRNHYLRFTHLPAVIPPYRPHIAAATHPPPQRCLLRLILLPATRCADVSGSGSVYARAPHALPVLPYYPLLLHTHAHARTPPPQLPPVLHYSASRYTTRARTAPPVPARLHYYPPAGPSPHLPRFTCPVYPHYVGGTACRFRLWFYFGLDVCFPTHTRSLTFGYGGHA